MRALAIAAVTLGSASILFSGVVQSAMADEISSTVSGGALSAVTSGIVFPSATLNGSNQVVTATAASEWSITDARGTGEKWTLSVIATDLSSAQYDANTSIRTIPIENVVIIPGTITAGEGSDSANLISASNMGLSESTQAFIWTHPTLGAKGTFTLTPEFNLNLPANAYKSNQLNPYISTITFTIA